jgi:hypothetical protein
MILLEKIVFLLVAGAELNCSAIIYCYILVQVSLVTKTMCTLTDIKL